MKAFLALALVACLSACSLVSPPTSPGAIAGTTLLDERALSGVELAYRVANTAATIAVDAGLLDTAAKATAAKLDNEAYAAVRAARQAYAAGNADSYDTAVSGAISAVTAFAAIIPRK